MRATPSSPRQPARLRFWAGGLVALLVLVTPAGAATAAPPAAEAYPLQHYLDGLAAVAWSRRAGELERIRTADDARARARFVREEFLRAIGGFPTEKTPLRARVTGVLERTGYRIEKVIYESVPGCFVTANLYVPTTGAGPFPAVLGAAGHAMPEGKASPVYQSAFIALALRGYVVLAYDPPAQGERFEGRDPATGAMRSLGHISPGLQCLLTGGTIARYFLWDGIRGLDYLLTRPEVDPKRIGAAGNSGGGTQSAFLGVCEPRIAAVASSCYWTSWPALWKAQGPQDSEQILPGWIHHGLDFSDLALAFAPKPILMLTATRDLFPVEGARAMHAEAKPLFRLLDAEPALGYFEYEDVHAWSKPRREATVAWFDRWFAGRTDFVKEPDHKTEPVAALRCTDTGHVVTALGSKTTQQLNEARALALYLQRALAREMPAARAREIVTARLALSRGAEPSAVAVQAEYREGALASEDFVLTVERGIDLPVRLFPAASASKRSPAVILLGEGPALLPAGHATVVRWQRAGYTVVSASPRGLPALAETKPYYTLAYKTAMRALLLGRTMAGWRVQDVLAIHAWARSLPTVEPGEVSLIGRGNVGILALYAAALEPAIARVGVERSLVSYLHLVRSPECPESYSDVIVPGVLADFDLPDLARLAGPRRVVLSQPLGADGTPVPAAEVRRAYGADIRLIADEAGLDPAGWRGPL